MSRESAREKEAAAEPAPARPRPAPLDPAPTAILSLQRGYGNAAVSRAILARGNEGDVAQAPAAPPFDPQKEVEKHLAAGFAIEDLAWAAYQVDADMEKVGQYLDFLKPYLAANQTPLARREFDKAGGDMAAAAKAVASVAAMKADAENKAREKAKAGRDAAGPDPEIKRQEDAIVGLREAAQKEESKNRKRGKRQQPKKNAPPSAAQQVKTAETDLEAYRQRLADAGAAAEESAVEAAGAGVLEFTETGGTEENERLYGIAGEAKTAAALRGPATAAGADPHADAMLKALAAEGPAAAALAGHATGLLSAGVPAVNAVAAAKLLARAPEARDWLIANGARKPEHIAPEIEWLAKRPKSAAVATKALTVLGYDGATLHQRVIDKPDLAAFALDETRVAPGLRPRVLHALGKAMDKGDADYIPRAFAQELAAGPRGVKPEALVDLFGQFTAQVAHDARAALLAGRIPTAKEAEFLEALGSMEVEKAVTYANQDPIPLPGHVTAMGWLAVDKIRYPIAFKTGQYETDSACLKHYEEWGGDNKKFHPVKASMAKMTNYFADLVAACDAAVEAWKSAGKPNELRIPASGDARPKPLDKGAWAINVKKADGGKAQVFHADSKYENSYWRTHDA